MADFGGMSADQINNSMGLGPGGVGAQGQNQLNNIFGNFGQQTDYYSGQGASYGRATGGFNGGAIDQNDPANIAKYWELMGGGGGGAGFPQAPDPAPPKPPAGAVDWSKYFTDMSAPAAAQPAYNPFTQYGNGGYNPFDPSSFAPAAQGNVGSQGGPYSPAYSAPGILNASDPGNIAEYYRLMGGGGGSFAPPPSQYDPGGSFAPPPGTSAQGPGGIGSDTSRDALAWTMAQSSPYATPGAPSNGPYPNLGYNPGMANSFANPTMRGGQIDQSDPGNIALYWKLMGGGSGANLGTPSQYTTQPYTNTQGQTFQPNIPQGFQTPFSVDNPTGALNAAEQQRIWAQTPRS